MMKVLAKGRKDQRGTALVEFAIVLPVIVILVLGVIKIGAIYRDYQSLSNMSRADARTGAAIGTQSTSDYYVLLGVKSAAKSHYISPTDVQQVVVYLAKTDRTGTPWSTANVKLCLSGTAVPGVCNVYKTSGGFPQPKDFSKTRTGDPCDVTKIDHYFCEGDGTTRYNGYSDGSPGSPNPDWIGVSVTLRHHLITGFIPGGTQDMTTKTIMQLEPDTATP